MKSSYKDTCTPDITERIAQLETLCHRHTENRGMSWAAKKTRGQLRQAAEHIVRTVSPHIAIITGFFIPHAKATLHGKIIQGAAETDGPLGAVVLATSLHALGMKVRLVTDTHCEGTLKASLAATGLLESIPIDVITREEPRESEARQSEAQQSAVQQSEASEARQPRVNEARQPRVNEARQSEANEARQSGASEARQSGASEARQSGASEAMQPGASEARQSGASGNSPSPNPYSSHWSSFASPLTHVISIERVGPGQHGHCRNMRGEDISAFTTPLHHLFTSEYGWYRVGIGDGGNELGMGCLDREEVAAYVPHGETIHCCVEADALMVCGVSNWGGAALAAAIALMCGEGEKIAGNLTREVSERILERMVYEGPAVDGVSGEQRLCVDGLDWEAVHAPIMDEMYMICKGSSNQEE